MFKVILLLALIVLINANADADKPPFGDSFNITSVTVLGKKFDQHCSGRVNNTLKALSVPSSMYDEVNESLGFSLFQDEYIINCLMARSSAPIDFVIGNTTYQFDSKCYLKYVGFSCYSGITKSDDESWVMGSQFVKSLDKSPSAEYYYDYNYDYDYKP